MKVIFQSDDYGITKAQACGCLEAIQHGIIRNTGMFTNMPWSEEVAEWIKPYKNQIALGVDLNASTGPSILGMDKIPSLLQEDGKTFKTSKQNRELDTAENKYDHVVYEEVYAEFDAQIQRFIEFFGCKPDYLHAHAYGTITTARASLDLAKKYDILYSGQIMADARMCTAKMGWYTFPPTAENQIQANLTKYITEDVSGFLTSDKEYGIFVCHTGYVDSDIFELSSFHIFRCKDLEGVTSKETLDWIQKNKIELITYNDIKDWVHNIPEEQGLDFFTKL